jgi:ferredoxin
MAARLSVDAARCMGHGRCYTAAPSLLSDDDEGFVTLRGTSMPIEPDQLAEAESARRACPERAVLLERNS